MAAKSLRVLGTEGAGKKTLIGSLIYKCKLDQQQIAELEREGVDGYANIVRFYKTRGRMQSFHGPDGPFVVEVPPSQKPDVAFWVVDGSDPASWSLSAQNLASSLADGTLQPQEKLVILINKMDLVTWSEETFKDAVRVFSVAKLKNRTSIIPISSLKGDNVLETPQDPSWVKAASGKPLMSAIG